MTDETKPGVVKKLAAKAVDRKQWDVPVWAIWLGGFLIFLALAGLVYGAIQHFRVGRWEALLKESRQMIVKLNNQNTSLRAKASGAHSDGTGEATSRALRTLDQKERDIVARGKVVDRKLQDSQATKRRIKDDVDNSDVNELLAKFAAEGFKGQVVVQPPPPDRPQPPPKERCREPCKESVKD